MAGVSGRERGVRPPRSATASNTSTGKECFSLTNVIYSIGVDTVDPVFFAVVPDSFMKRASGTLVNGSDRVEAEEWSDEQDLPLTDPADRWSF